MKRPISLTIAVALQWAAAVVAIFAGFDLVAAAYEMSNEGVAQQIEGALVGQGIVDVSGSRVVVAVFVAGVLLLAIALVRVMVAVYLARGRTWARTVIAVLVAISLIGGVSYLFQGFVLLAFLTVSIDVIVLWLMYNERSSAFIRERSARGG